MPYDGLDDNGDVLSPEVQAQFNKVILEMKQKYEARRERLMTMPVNEFVELAHDIDVPVDNRRRMVEYILSKEFPSR